LGTKVTSVIYIREEVKSRLNSRDPCYCLVQNLMSYRLLSKIVRIEKYKTIIVLVVFYGIKLVCHTKRRT
jgi:hypothetical protein